MKKVSLPALVSVLLTLCLALPALAVPPPPTARQILEAAMKDAKNKEALERALGEVEVIVKNDPKDVEALYAKGWILSRLGQPGKAVAAYSMAFAFDPKFADAAYNAGVVLTDMGQSQEALKMFEAASKAAPKHVDALYNAGQVYYNLKRFPEALDRWKKAEKLAPKDFFIKKKVLQAYHAVGDLKGAKRARAAVWKMWKTTKDQRLKAMTEVCVDQFPVGDLHIYAYETFAPAGDLYYVYTFKATDKDNQLQGTTQLESSAVMREMGDAKYVLGVTLPGGTHKTIGPMFKKLPTYQEVKKVATEAIKTHLVQP